MQTLLYLKSILRQARQRNAENVFLTFRSRYAHTPVTEQSKGPMDTVTSRLAWETTQYCW